MLLPSGADAAYLLAQPPTARAGRAFVRKMNAKARKLGMTKTHFANFDGLPWPTPTAPTPPARPDPPGRGRDEASGCSPDRCQRQPLDREPPGSTTATTGRTPTCCCDRYSGACRHQDRLHQRQPDTACCSRPAAGGTRAHGRRAGQHQHRHADQVHRRRTPADLGIRRDQTGEVAAVDGLGDGIRAVGHGGNRACHAARHDHRPPGDPVDELRRLADSACPKPGTIHSSLGWLRRLEQLLGMIGREILVPVAVHDQQRCRRDPGSRAGRRHRHRIPASRADPGAKYRFVRIRPSPCSTAQCTRRIDGVPR